MYPVIQLANSFEFYGKCFWWVLETFGARAVVDIPRKNQYMRSRCPRVL